MTSESGDGSGGAATTLEDLPERVRRSLLRGFRAGHWWLEEDPRLGRRRFRSG